MIQFIQYLNSLGHIFLDVFWFPLGIWTFCCGLAFLLLRNIDNLNPLFHYHLRAAALVSLPIGMGIAAFLNQIPGIFNGSKFETALFVVQNPFELTVTSNASTTVSAINWSNPNLYIGIITLGLGLVSLIMLIKLFKNYLTLKTLYRNLTITNLRDIQLYSESKRSVKLAFHNHPLVPFTFGWKQPVIVLPKILQHEPEKMEMALQHELTHIKRGDYLLQLALSIIESFFWFHPLIRYGNQEIDTYREISCDQEVLSKSDFSTKSYANLLYELVPLRNGLGRLSVSMAVQQSTLTKRIKTMNNHKLHQTSFRQSIAFLMLMIVGITLPIACSDLQGSDSLSMKDLENATLQLQDPKLSINGVNIQGPEGYGEIETPGLGALILNTTHGTFKIAPRRFDDGIQAGHIKGNTVSFRINEMNVEVSSSTPILTGFENSSVWVQHLPYKADANTYGAITDALNDIPPPPPSPTNAAQNQDDGDYFVVVEKMPELIGGIKSLQSKIEYPDTDVEGQVVVQFIVNENGDVEDAQVVRGIGGGADEEALRVIREANFKPGMQRGKAVRVRLAVPINFRLEDSDFKKGES